jgi:hypothetical protein
MATPGVCSVIVDPVRCSVEMECAAGIAASQFQRTDCVAAPRRFVFGRGGETKPKNVM